jgi:hypothetical protein
VGYIGSRSALGWWRGGFALLRRAPWRIAAWSLLPLLVEILLQALPTIGVVASKLLTPLAGVLSVLAFARIARGQPVNGAALGAGLRRIGAARLVALALVAFAIYLLQVLVAAAVYGAAAVDVAVLGRTSGHEELLADRSFLLLLVLVGLVPGVLLLFVTPLVALADRSVAGAVSQSAGALLSSPAALALTYGLTALLVALAITWGQGIALLLVVPMLSAVYFAAYVDVFGLPPDRTAPAGSARRS